MKFSSSSSSFFPHTQEGDEQKIKGTIIETLVLFWGKKSCVHLYRKRFVSEKNTNRRALSLWMERLNTSPDFAVAFFFFFFSLNKAFFLLLSSSGITRTDAPFHGWLTCYITQTPFSKSIGRIIKKKEREN